MTQLQDRAAALWEAIHRVNFRGRVNAVINAVDASLGVARPPVGYPIRLDVVLTKACNLRCQFCISYGSLGGHRWMDFELYEKLARQLFPWSNAVLFCSGGEPFLYPHLREALRLARAYRNLVRLFTNGMLLDRGAAQWLVADQSLDELVFSFDGARPETLEGIRRGASYDAILENLDYLVYLRGKQRRRRPRIFFHYIIMQRNAGELPEMVDLAVRHGVSGLWVNYLNAMGEEDFQESLFHQGELADRVFAAARRRGEERGLQVVLPPPLEEAAVPRTCWQPWQFCQIDTDGSLRFCYRSWRQRLGFFQDGFASIWRGDHYRKLRATVNTDRPYYPFCRYCPERLGYGQAAAHNVQLHPEAQVIPGLEAWQIPFNRRAEENILSFREVRQAPGQPGTCPDLTSK